MALAEIGRELGDFFDQKLVTIGTTEVTVLSVASFVAALVAFYVIARLIGRALSRWLVSRSGVEPGVGYAMARVLQYTVIGIGLLISFQLLGIDLGSVAIMLGALGVGIGLGLQSLSSNFISGIILLFERPVRVGDRIQVGDIEGDVVEINMRATTVKSITNVSVIVPNSEFVNSTVINWSHGDTRLVVWVDVGVSYSSDLDAVLEALLDVARAHPLILDHPPPLTRFVEFGDSAWKMRLIGWIAEAKDHYLVRSELNEGIARTFRERGIEIPFPQRDLHWRSPLPMSVDLPGAGRGADGGGAG